MTGLPSHCRRAWPSLPGVARPNPEASPGSCLLCPGFQCCRTSPRPRAQLWLLSIYTCWAVAPGHVSECHHDAGATPSALTFPDSSLRWPALHLCFPPLSQWGRGGRVPASIALLTSRSSSRAHSSGPLWSLSNGSGEVAPGSRHPVSLRCTATPCSPSQFPAGSPPYSPPPKLLRAPAAFAATPASLRVPGNPRGLLLHGCAVPFLSWFPFLHPSVCGGLLWGFAFGPNGASVLGNPGVGLHPRPLPQNTSLPTCHLHSVWQASRMPQNPTSQF